MTKLSKTDIILQDEQKRIINNRHKLVIGNQYSYKKLTEVLGIRYLNGKSKRIQVENIRKYIKWGDDFVVRDNSVNVSVLDEAWGKNVRNKYIEDSSALFLYRLVEYFRTNIKHEYLTLSTSKAISMMGLVSGSFLLATECGSEVVAEVFDLEVKQVIQYMAFVRERAREIFESTCKRLNKKNLIIFNKEMYIIREMYIPEYKELGLSGREYSTINMYAMPEEVEKIQRLEKEILQEMKCKNYYQAHIMGRYGELKRNVCRRMEIEGYWKAYDIWIASEIENDVIERYGSIVDELCDTLKSEFMQSIINSKAKVLQLKSTNNKSLLEKMSRVFIYGDQEFDNKVKNIVERNKAVSIFNSQSLHSNEQDSKVINREESCTEESIQKLLDELFEEQGNTNSKLFDTEEEQLYIEEEELTYSHYEEIPCFYKDDLYSISNEELGIGAGIMESTSGISKHTEEELGLVVDIPCSCSQSIKRVEEELGI